MNSPELSLVDDTIQRVFQQGVSRELLKYQSTFRGFSTIIINPFTNLDNPFDFYVIDLDLLDALKERLAYITSLGAKVKELN